MKHSSVTMSLMVKYSALFPDEPIDIKKLLSKYGRKLVLQMVGVLNSMLQRDIKALPQQVMGWFGPEDPQGHMVMKLIFKGYRSAIRNGESLHIINSHSNLRLNQIAMTIPEIDENTNISVSEAHMDFFKAYLYLNQEYLQKQENISNTIPDEATGIAKATWMGTATLVSYYDFSYYTESMFICQVVKAYYCFQFIEVYHPELYKKYLNSLNVSSFTEYAQKILPLTQLCFTDVVSFNAKTEDDRMYLALYAESNSIEDNVDNAADFDFLQIRNKPLAQISENQFVILNRAMIVNKIYTSIYWDVKSILNANPDLHISQNKFRTDYTTDFSEGYLVYKLLEKSYEAKDVIRYSGEEMKEYMGNAEPDYYIRDQKNVFLYEVKDSFLAGTVKQSFNATEIEAELRKKYYKSGNSEKAVQQLITRIGFSLRKQYPFDSQYETDGLNIYPIIIVYDLNLTVPGIERQLVRWFNEEREILVTALNEEGITGFQIKDLVVLHIDGLVLLSDYLKADKFKMEVLIDEFNSRTNKLLNELNGKEFKQIKSNVLSSLLSFDHYVGDYINAIPVNERMAPLEINFMD